MKLKPIHNDEEYEAALQEIDRLWDAEADTPEGDAAVGTFIRCLDYDFRVLGHITGCCA